jgi:hypothetical protein
MRQGQFYLIKRWEGTGTSLLIVAPPSSKILNLDRASVVIKFDSLA